MANTRFLQFGSPQVRPTNAVMNSAWGGAMKAENDDVLLHSHSQLSETRRNLFPGSLACQQSIESMLSQASACQQLPLIPRLRYNVLGMEDEAAISNLVADGSSNANNMHFQGMFQIISDGSTAGAPH
ncbi:squamosa promoter-binding-like protein 13A isoform X2 [Prunus yedoensis var. nudiflora]|uniref:Squamosa promoter-binding-like protein 13A isoform X2 n=1 Tax=Prunus yedoensis var. nudiflora TaxID=2094558 RepID=A0A314ZPS8_PRUYE|nr:squamosa promoter-binding-like protein 13A isoform X2 [Prunus yedoensis var. nudiflora]